MSGIYAAALQRPLAERANQGIVSPVQHQSNVVITMSLQPNIGAVREMAMARETPDMRRKNPYRSVVSDPKAVYAVRKHELLFVDRGMSGGPGSAYLVDALVMIGGGGAQQLFTSFNNMSRKSRPRFVGIVDTAPADSGTPGDQGNCVVCIQGPRSCINTGQFTIHPGDRVGVLPPVTYVASIGGEAGRKDNRPSIQGIPDSKMLAQTVPLTIEVYGPLNVLTSLATGMAQPGVQNPFGVSEMMKVPVKLLALNAYMQANPGEVTELLRWAAPALAGLPLQGGVPVECRGLVSMAMEILPSIKPEWVTMAIKSVTTPLRASPDDGLRALGAALDTIATAALEKFASIVNAPGAANGELTPVDVFLAKAREAYLALYADVRLDATWRAAVAAMAAAAAARGGGGQGMALPPPPRPAREIFQEHGKYILQALAVTASVGACNDHLALMLDSAAGTAMNVSGGGQQLDINLRPR